MFSTCDPWAHCEHLVSGITMFSACSHQVHWSQIVGDILNATTMCPARTLKLHFRAHFICFQHVIPGHIVNTWCLESQCSLHVLTVRVVVFLTVLFCYFPTHLHSFFLHFPFTTYDPPLL